MEATEYKLCREKTGLTQSACAEFLGVSRETIARREAGVAKIGMEAALAIRELANSVRLASHSPIATDAISAAVNALGKSEAGQKAIQALLPLFNQGGLKLQNEELGYLGDLLKEIKRRHYCGFAADQIRNALNLNKS